MPGGLHLAHLTIHRVSDAVPVVGIANGLAPWELEWVRRRLPLAAVAHLPVVSEHGIVLDALFDHVQGDFGILDYDCFVLQPELVRDVLRFEDGTSMNAAFFRHNAALDLDVPETFLLAFRAPVIREIRARYGVVSSPYRWDELPLPARERLAKAGFGPDRLPEAHKPYFDTLRAIMMLARAEGLPYRFVRKHPATPTPSDEVYHVGGVAEPNVVKGVWALRGSYFWRRALETVADDELKARYYRQYGSQLARDLLRQDPETAAQISPAFLEYCETLLQAR